MKNHTRRLSRLFTVLAFFCAVHAAAQTPPGDRQRNPCMYTSEARRFDFFVGEWDAYARDGRRVGSSVIERIANGCGVLENWTGTGGGNGKSINFYDAEARKWFEYWIGANGKPLRFSGVFRDGALRFEGEPFRKDGKRFLTRLTFFNVDPQTVRQLSEQSADEGKTWTVAYDFKYVRRAATTTPAAPPAGQ